jgi:probable HAF family extracellular repeat protein
MLALSTILCPPSAGAQSYTFKTLDFPGAVSTSAQAINAAGEIVGYFNEGRGFILNFGSFEEATFSTFPGTACQTHFFGVNDAGLLVGDVAGALPPDPGTTDGPGCGNPSAWSSLGQVHADFAIGINNAGQIVGYNVNPPTGYLLSGGAYSTIAFPGASWTVASGISADIVGWYGDGGGHQHGYLLKAGNYSTIDVPGSTMTEAWGINGGLIVGIYANAQGAHGFLLQGDTYRTIDVPGASSTFAFGVNALGQIVGSFTDTNGHSHGFVASPQEVPQKATMTTPAPGSTLTGSAVTFNWAAGSGASAYWLDVGTVPGEGNIFAGNVGLSTGQAVNGIPISGATIYVRLWTQLSGNWVYNDYTYTAFGSGTKATIARPAPGSTLSGGAVTFTWAAGRGASAYWLDVGIVQGEGNIFAGNVGLSTSQTVNGIPTSGGTIYVRLWTQLSGNWVYNDYTYIAFFNGTKATMITPAPGSMLSGAVTFNWAAGSSASAYWLDVGTVPGQGNLFAGNVGLSTSQAVNGIPTSGGTIYVRLWTQFSGNWVYNDYTYTAFASGSF